MIRLQNRYLSTTIMILLGLSLTARCSDDPTAAAPLPPAPPWEGKSLSLVRAKGHPWITPAEASDFQTTPRYRETVDWLRRLTDASLLLEMVSLGPSHEGRDIFMIFATTEGTFSPATLQAGGKPTLLVQAGIHAGEIDGKDAGLMLLRDMTVVGSKTSLLDKANLLFIPILNVDGHERFSPYGRINQRGPAAVGWRTNAQNMNLNRDYAKLDTPELRALVRVLNTWAPDLYLDIHVTDGVDYQYDITWGYNDAQGYSPAGAGWMENFLTPTLSSDLTAMGHIPGELVFAVDDRDISRGLLRGISATRYSQGYGDARHLPTVLVENHSLKPYRQRVLGTYVLLESTLRVLGTHGQELQQALRQDQARRPNTIPLTWRQTQGNTVLADFLGLSSRLEHSQVSGTDRIVWTGQPVNLKLPVLTSNTPEKTVTRPQAYWVPPAWPGVIERLALHGLQFERMASEKTVDVEMYRLAEPNYATGPYEGHLCVTASIQTEKHRQLFAPGSVRVTTDQPLGDLAILLLEPDSPDSFFQWGFFNSIMQRTEYVEGYVMDPLAERMLAQDPNLSQTFQRKLEEDKNFAANPRARLQWFYQQTPYYDDQWHLYPVAREP